MPLTDLYFKVVVDHDRDERIERIVAEIERQIRKMYLVRMVEYSHAVRRSDD